MKVTDLPDVVLTYDRLKDICTSRFSNNSELLRHPHSPGCSSSCLPPEPTEAMSRAFSTAARRLVRWLGYPLELLP